ncbi:hypothetical protein BC834DRAFT_304689 [Gloeopeniophorella convolvens]|nr:hypothetical protein BC834DRAFT_304689 [Gloeopeniophorella convolvens]
MCFIRLGVRQTHCHAALELPEPHCKASSRDTNTDFRASREDPAAHGVPNSHSKQTSASPRLGWLLNTHVCHQWRHVAISHAILWTQIPFVLGQHWADTFILRSQRSGLIMRYRMPELPTVSPISATTFSNNIHQTRDLRLVRNSREIQKVATALVDPAPLLETFSLNVEDYSWRNFPVILPSNLFAGHAPRLHTLLLSEVHIRWDSPLLRNLTKLYVYNTELPTGGRASFRDGSTVWTYVPDSDLAPSCDRLLDVLCACPNLCDLTLLGCLPPIHDAHADTPPVSLQHLERLDLGGRLGGVECIFKHCTFPLSCVLGVRINLSVSELPRITSVLHPISSAAHTYPFCAMLVAMDSSVEIGAWRTFQVTAWGGANFRSPPDARIILDLRHGARPAQVVSENVVEMMRVCDLLVPENMDTVAVQLDWKLRHLSMPFLGRTKMEHLHVRAEPPETAFFVGTPDTETEGPRVLYPALKTIWISYVNLELTSPNGLSFAGQLLLWLTRRSEAGMVLEAIVLDRCEGVTPELLEDFKGIVRRVGVRSTDRGDPEMC